jgi:hypothetical protein
VSFRVLLLVVLIWITFCKCWCFRLVAQSAATCSHWFLARGFFYLEDEGDRFLRNVGSHNLYGATSQKTAFFIVTAIKTSDLTRIFITFTVNFSLSVIAF